MGHGFREGGQEATWGKGVGSAPRLTFRKPSQDEEGQPAQVDCAGAGPCSHISWAQDQSLGCSCEHVWKCRQCPKGLLHAEVCFRECYVWLLGWLQPLVAEGPNSCMRKFCASEWPAGPVALPVCSTLNMSAASKAVSLPAAEER